MNKQLLIIVIAILLLSVGLSGCTNQEETIGNDYSEEDNSSDYPPEEEKTWFLLPNVYVDGVEIMELSATEATIDTKMTVYNIPGYQRTLNKIDYDLYYKIPEVRDDGTIDWDSGTYQFIGHYTDEKKRALEEEKGWMEIHTFFTVKNQDISQVWFSFMDPVYHYLTIIVFKIEGTINFDVTNDNESLNYNDSFEAERHNYIQ